MWIRTFWVRWLPITIQTFGCGVIQIRECRQNKKDLWLELTKITSLQTVHSITRCQEELSFDNTI
jgi:hypothetical protein